ncbi:MAG: glycosyltransferase family 2 protein [Actinobacteria bacterium]|nr:glycosyltransferase family 2 protein [Actinomycetota bacterium]
MKPFISVVINTFNEENNLLYTLLSVKSWVDEIVVVDMYSDDKTVEIALKNGAKVFFHERAGFVEPARSYSIAQSHGEWVLILDADELVSQPLSLKLLEIARNDTADVVTIPRLNYFIGEPLMHTGWGPEQDKHARFFKRGFMQNSERIHDAMKPLQEARISNLSYETGYAIVHFNYFNITHFIEKLNRYTTIESVQAFNRGERTNSFKSIILSIKEFLSRYIKRGGYRDGWRGFYLALIMVFYKISVSAKLKELEAVGDRNIIELLYRKEAQLIIDEYNKGPNPL